MDSNRRYCWDILLSQQMLHARQCTGALCAEHSPTAAAQNFQPSFS